MRAHRRSIGPAARRAAVCAGVGLIAAATLMYEILLTRIFSVTMWYHFAFLAVAAALLGMTIGGVLVQLRPRTFTVDAAPRLLGLHALCFAVSVPVTFLVHLLIPFSPIPTPSGLASILGTYLVVATPFVFAGVSICLALTKGGGDVGTVYAADLAGAGLGCLATVAALRIANAPTAVLLVAAVGGAAAVAFALAAARRALAGVALAVTIAALGVVAASPSRLSVTWVKGQREQGPTLYDRWNSYSRIRVSGDPGVASAPFGWGLSPRYPRDRRVPQLLLSIDAIADTVLTRFDGDLASVDHLHHDVTNVAHYLRPDARVLVVGAGGGRDVLAALAFEQRQVVAVEVNEAILEAVNGRFGDFTGHLDRRPGVEFVNDEARSWIARLDGRFDLIQVSFIDTFAATAAGAYVLTEHSLYTIEAWRTFLDRLAPGGLLSVSRWYFHESPAEIYRLVALATGTLLESGVARPRDHLLLLRTQSGADPNYRETIGVGTLLIGRQPLAAADVTEAHTVAARLGFEVVLDPGGARDPTLAALTAPATFADTIAASPLDISPPTDDRPFFFHVVPLRRAFRLTMVDQGNVSFNVAAVIVLVGAVVVAAGLAGTALAGVRVLRRRQPDTRALHGWDALFFAAVGLGYILVEISQLHRLTVFLGHPAHALVVVLFALLLSSGAGSFAVRTWPAHGTRLLRVGPVLIVPVILLVFGLLTPAAITELRGLATPLRILVAVALLAPIGFAMGMAFPRGLQIVARRAPTATPWLWAINGATSVLGSLAAVLVSLAAGVSAAFWLGVAAYVVAAVSCTRMVALLDRSARTDRPLTLPVGAA